MVVTLLHLGILKTKFCRKKKEQRQHKATQSHVETISWFMIVDVSIKAFTFGDQLNRFGCLLQSPQQWWPQDLEKRVFRFRNSSVRMRILFQKLSKNVLPKKQLRRKK
jgi:hypothetical protein